MKSIEKLELNNQNILRMSLYIFNKLRNWIFWKHKLIYFKFQTHEKITNSSSKYKKSTLFLPKKHFMYQNSGETIAVNL